MVYNSAYSGRVSEGKRGYMRHQNSYIFAKTFHPSSLAVVDCADRWGLVDISILLYAYVLYSFQFSLGKIMPSWRNSFLAIAA